MLPDPEALIRRSGAAAPLLNAVRERRDRDSVRSAIDRLTGRTQGTGTVPAADQSTTQPATGKPE
jgi:AsmA protein